MDIVLVDESGNDVCTAFILDVEWLPPNGQKINVSILTEKEFNKGDVFFTTVNSDRREVQWKITIVDVVVVPSLFYYYKYTATIEDS